MRYYTLLLILLLAMSSCNGPMKHNHSRSLSFHWSYAGILPADSQGVPSPGLAGPFAGVSHNRLLIGGGSNFPDGAPWEGGEKRYYDQLYIFKKKKDSLICISHRLHLPYAVAYSANCSTEKGIVVAGGENEAGAINRVLLLNWNNEREDVVVRYLPDLPLALTNGMITARKDILYFAGGENNLGVSNQFYTLDLNDASSGWKKLGALKHPVTNGLLLADDSSIYLIGGRKREIDSTSDLYDEVYCYDLNKREWKQKASLPYPLSAHTGVKWNDSTLLVLSGDKGATFHLTEVLLMKIAHEKNKVKREQLITEKNELQKSHPGFSGDVLAYNTRTDEWKKVDSIPFPGPVTTTAVRWDNKLIIPCGEIRAGVRTPDIIMGDF